jgi:hypothetical protein
MWQHRALYYFQAWIWYTVHREHQIFGLFLSSLSALSSNIYRDIYTYYSSLLFTMAEESSSVEADNTSLSTLADSSCVCLGQFPGNLDGRLWESWVRFVYDTRIISGMNWEMKPTGRKTGWECDCHGRSRIAYPHWPPTTHKEAFDQLCMLTQRHNCHHRYLAMQWWSEVTRASTLTIKTPAYREEQTNIANDIRALCPSIDMELEDSHLHIRQRSEGWECYNLCDMVIDLGSSTCLCFCDQHREDCPVHDASRM